MEHHSNVVPWQLLCEEQGARLEYLRVDGDGRLDLDRARRAARRRPGAARRASRTSRTCSARSTRSRRSPSARTPRARWCCVDGAQAVPQMPVDVKATGADFYAFTGHKMLGPTGIGVLWARRELLEEMPPFLGGGSMIKAVEDDHSTWADAARRSSRPARPRSPRASGSAPPSTTSRRSAWTRCARTSARSPAYALERLAALDGVTVYGPARRRGARRPRELRGRGHPPARPRRAVQPRGGLHPRRPPLRPAADATPGRARHGPRLVLGLQHDARKSTA